jgi:hypothetical protein
VIFAMIRRKRSNSHGFNPIEMRRLKS